jgi:hypothetical protein
MKHWTKTSSLVLLAKHLIRLDVRVTAQKVMSRRKRQNRIIGSTRTRSKHLTALFRRFVAAKLVG